MAEKMLWNALRRNQIGGLHFRRQHPVGRFILDFYCPAVRLAIEVDGKVHDKQVERHQERTTIMESAGYRVLRFRNEEVSRDLPSVIRRIEDAIKPNTPAPSS